MYLEVDFVKSNLISVSAGCPLSYKFLQVVLFYENPDISGMLKERLHLAESGKDDEVAKKVKL